ncbi:MAG: protein kinase [Gemmataceae bacterium]|nr:protein kinase [Gemmataceae bacterium]
MPIRVQCPVCGKTADVPERYLGQRARCPRCKHEFSLSASTDGSRPAQSNAPRPAAERKSPSSGSAENLGQSASSLEPTSLPAHIGGFEVRTLHGGGAFGTVYRAYDPQLEREVALKVPRADLLQNPKVVGRFLREAKAVARLRHPHIVPVYDAGQDGPYYYIVAAFIEGRTLSEVIEEGRLDFRRATQIVRDLAEALAYAHGLGIVHRDVKSDNVLVDTEGEAHLTDFGLAYRHDSAGNLSHDGAVLGMPPHTAPEHSPDKRDSAEKLTHAGAVLGTPAYMAPEQAQGKQGEALPASDQYSLGVVLYEILCGRTPFSGPPDVVRYNVLHREPPSPRTLKPQIPKDLETICLKAMAKQPEARYATCQELADDLRRWFEGEPIRARRLRPVERATRWCRRKPVVAGLLASVLLLLVLVAVVASVGYMRAKL